MSARTVFLSHRRKDFGKHFARLLERELTHKGFDVFLDVETIEAGKWETQILAGVAQRAHFLLLLTPGCFDGCDSPDDWVRREFERAVETNRNIVLIFEQDAHYDELKKTCPEPMRTVFQYQGHRIHDTSFGKDIEILLEKYLHPSKAPRDTAPLQENAIIQRLDAIAEQQKNTAAHIRSRSGERRLESSGEPTDEFDSKAGIQGVDPVPSEAPKSWLRRNAVLLVMAAVLACVLAWATFYQNPRLHRIKKGVDTASRAFLRDLGRQDPNAITESVTLPFFFGDHEFRNPEDLRAFFERLFQLAKSGTGRTSDSVVIRKAVELSIYLAGEMQREYRDVFETVKIEIRSDLDREKEDDRGTIPPPRLPLSDASRAMVQLAGFKPVKVIYLYFSGGHAAEFRGALLVGDSPALDARFQPSRMKLPLIADGSSRPLVPEKAGCSLKPTSRSQKFAQAGPEKRVVLKNGSFFCFRIRSPRPEPSLHSPTTSSAATADANSEVSFVDLPAGRYRLRFTSDKHEPHHYIQL